MVPRTLPYHEGDWFVLPLRREGRFAIGRIARSSSRGKILFGYFFGPARPEMPTLADAQQLSHAEVVMKCRFGDLGLINGEWKVLGQMGDWEREFWPMPPFVRVDHLNEERAVLVTYSDVDPAKVVSETSCDPKLASKYPRDALAGYGAVEIRLTKILLGQDEND